MNNSFEKMNIQWFPGHMTKAQRMIEDNIKMVDAVCEIVDARIPISSRNPDIDDLGKNKARLIIMNKKSLLTLALMASFSVALVGCGDKPKKVERKPVAVAVMPVQVTDTYRWIETYGQTEGAQEIEVRAQVGGILRQLNFKEGSFVNFFKSL